VQTGPNNGTLDIYTKSGVVDEIQTLNDISIETVDEISKQLGVC
jgi:hypothetical protein